MADMAAYLGWMLTLPEALYVLGLLDRFSAIIFFKVVI